MLYIGLDDTDVAGSPGTNRLARRIVGRLARWWRVFGVTRHQLLLDPRVPYTSKNSSAAIMLRDAAGADLGQIARRVARWVREGSSPGSDPGLCVARSVPPAVRRFGRRAKEEVLDQARARELAARSGVLLAGLGGSEDGVVGALAAVGLAATGEDGRFVQLGAWPDDLCWEQPAEALLERGVEEFIAEPGGGRARPARINVGKRLRPSYRAGKVVLYVRRGPEGWQAVRKS